MKTYTMLEARRDLSEIIGQAMFANEPSLITKSSSPSAVVISYEDYKRFRELEDQSDGAEAQRRLEANSKRYTAERAKKILDEIMDEK